MKYHAFISYSYKDKAWGAWVHRALETYRIPAGLEKVAEHYSGDGSVPRRLYPIFRDRDELPTADHITEKVKDALRESRALVVVCSPNSAGSEWVANEIRTFREYHPDRPVLALLAAGEPPGCFPELLRENPPLAADVRAGGDGKRDSRLKLVAGLLGTGLGDLRNRDAQRQRRRSLIFGSVAAAIALVMSGLALAAFRARNDAVFQQKFAELQTDAAVARNLAATSPEQALRMAVETSEKHLKLTGDLSDSTVSSLISGLEYHRRNDWTASLGIPLDFELSPDGTEALAVINNGYLKLVNFERRSVETLLNRKGLADAAYLPEGDAFFIGNESGEVALHDRKGGLKAGPWQAHELPVRVSVLSEPLRLVSVGLDGRVDLWSPTGDPIATDIQLGSYSKLAFDLTGPRFATLPALDFSTSLVLNDARKGENSIYRFPNQSTLVSAVVFDHSGKHLATGTLGAEVRLWDSESFTAVQSIPGHGSEITALAFDPSGQQLASGSLTGSIRVVNLFGELMLPPLNDGGKAIRFLNYLPDGNSLVSVDDDGNLRIWDVQGLQSRRPVDVGSPVRGVVLSPDGSRLAAGTIDGKLKIWDLKTDEQIHVESLFPGLCGPLGTAAGGKVLVIASERERELFFRDWDGNPASDKIIFPEDVDGINFLQTDPETGLVHAWSKTLEDIAIDVAKGEIVSRRQFEGVYKTGWHRPHLLPTDIDRDGNIVISPPAKDRIAMINLRTFETIAERFVNPTFGCFTAKPFRGVIAAGQLSEPNAIGFFRYPSLEPAGLFQTGVKGEISGLKWVGEQGTLAVASHQGELRFFSSRGAALGPTIRAHSQAVQGLVSWPERDTLISFGADGFIRFWTVGPDAWLRLSRERLGITP